MTGNIISPAGFDRREMLRRAIWLAGGAAALSAFGTGEVFAAAAAPFFDTQHRAILEELCELMLPATDTPGAREAGVPAFIDAMMANWASPGTRLQLANVLDAVDARARIQSGDAFLRLSQDASAKFVAAYDADAYADGDAAWRRFKELVFTGYYLSEVGATKELRYIQVPGAWHSDIALQAGDRAWAI